MTPFEIFEALFGSGTLILLIIGVFRLGKFSNKFETLTTSFNKLENDIKGDFLKIDGEIKAGFLKMEAKTDRVFEKISNIDISIGKLETRVEERTLKVIHVERNGTEHQGKPE